MQRFAVSLVAVLLVSRVWAADTPTKLSAPALAATIDVQINTKIKTQKAIAAPLADDAELVRRLHLDLAGRIPEITVARDFIESPDKDKRSKLIDSLLSDERYAIHWAAVWRNWVISEMADQQLGFMGPPFETWMRSQLKNNARYDKVVREMLVGTVGFFGGDTGPGAFLQSNLYKPENLAASVSRLFLGVKIECAQCHDHPTSKWKRRQFWETAAFFTELGDPFGMFDADGRPVNRKIVAGQIKIPGSDKVATARFLDGAEPKEKANYRSSLVSWMTRKDNPYFSRAVANRVWEQLMGTGLVEPVDEESPDNPPSHPEVLALLAEQFTAHDYDLKYLIRAIVSTQAYQRTSHLSHRSQTDTRLFARMRVRGLSPEQLFDSLTVATGHEDTAQPQYDPRFARRGISGEAGSRADFIRRFPAPERRTEQQTSILQALYLMNGKIVSNATSLEHNRNLAIIAQGTSVRTARRIEQVFLIALNRKPTTAESERLTRYVDRGGPNRDPAQALCDVFWALLNSSEFCVNH